VNAILARARAELRTGFGPSLALILLLGVMGGAVMAPVAGARRQDSAYPRFVAASGAPDAFVVSSVPGSGAPFPIVDLARVSKLPQVERATAFQTPFGVAMSSNGDLLWGGGLNILAPTGDPAVDQFEHPRILAGRLPDPGRTDEAAVGYQARPDPGVSVGATIRIALVKPGVNPFEFADEPPKEDLLPPIDVHVVGMVLYPGELVGSSDVFVSAAFIRRYVGQALTYPALLVRLKGGETDFPAFARAVDAKSPGAFLFSGSDEVQFVNRSVHLQAIALWLFAALAGLAGVLIFAQSVARQTVLAGAENPTLRALGMTPNQLVGVAMARAAAIGLGGAAIAIIFAVALSPLTPIGLARVVEPNPGVAIDPVALGLGGLILVGLVPLVAALPAWRMSRAAGDALGISAPARTRPSGLADAFARAGLPPTAVTGVRLALEAGRGRTAVPVRSTVLGVTIALAAFTTSFAFLGSYRHLISTPRLYGVDFDLGVGNPFLEAKAGPEILRVLQEDPGVAEFSGGNILQFVQVKAPDGSSERINIWSFDPVQGSVHLTVVEGRWPRTANEIALGGRSMRAVGTGIGRNVTVEVGGQSAILTVVGRIVVPEGGFGPGLGEGGGMTYQGLRRFFPDAAENAFPVRLVPGASTTEVTARLNQELMPFGGSVDDLKDTPNISNLKRIQSLPLLLAGLLALAGAATLMHTLVSSIRWRRRDLAVLKTLGFLRGQVSAAVAWQATTLVVLALLIGIPLGIAAGRWGWNFFANQLGIVPEPRISVVPLLLAVPATVLLANLIALLPGRAASRVSPAVVLRSE
jgi:hypothetical protein